MKGLVFLILLGTHAAQALNKTPELLLRIEKKYSQSDTLMATFTQVNESKALKSKKTSHGVISIKRPNKIRWETQSPEPSIFISDGKTFWFYTPPFDESENGQLVVKKASENQSKLAATLLGGSFSVAKEMKIQQKMKNRFELIPKPGTAGDIVSAEVVIDPTKLLIEKLVLTHAEGNRSEITLEKILLGGTVDDSMFKFVPPPKTDRVKE